jgi:hypothetical protein
MEEVLAIGGFFVTVIVLGLGIPLLRIYSRSRERRDAVQPVDPERERRLERIEHAIEAMAIEVERISEGQRFVTKLLSESERAKAALPPRRE